MPQIINTNLASINAQRNLDKSQAANQTAMQRLSSGLRINSAKDDAAGMAISTRFTSQIKGLNVAVRNAGDGIALAQTAEGALGSMNDNLQRIRELAVQSANATNSDVDREALQAEVKQLVAEITRTADETDFNGRKLLDGSFKATFQVGANAGQTLDISIAELTADKLGSSAKAGLSAQGTSQKLSNGDLVINGENIRASVAGDDALSYQNKEASGIAKVAAINAKSDQTGVTATVDENVVLGSKIATPTGAATAASGTIKLNGVEIALQGTDNTDEIAKAGTRNAVMAAINSKSGQTGVVAEDGGAAGGVILKAADGRNITIELGTGTTDDDLANLGLAASGTSYAGYTLTAANANTPINIDGGNGTGNGDVANAGLKVGNYTAQTAATSNTQANISGFNKTYVAADLSDEAAGDPILQTDMVAINDILNSLGADSVSWNTDADTTATDIATSINAAIGKHSGTAGTQSFADGNVSTILGGINALSTASANAADKRAEARALQDGDLVINGVTIGASSALDDKSSYTGAKSSDGAASAIAIAAAINKSSDATGVKANVNATEFVGGAFTGTVDAAHAGQTLTLTLNGVEISLANQGDYEKNKAAAISAINERAGETGVNAVDNGVSLTLTAADGRNITMFAQQGAAGANTEAASFGLTGLATAANGGAATQVTDNATTVYGTVTLSSSSAFEVAYGTAGKEGLDDTGLKAGKFGGGEDGQALTDIDISTFEGAQKAMVAIDNAIASVASQRADLGAIQNRMNSTVENLKVTSENLSAANSRILDADFAAETAEMARTQILQQAGISILAQANASGQNVLSLLG